MNRTVIFCGGMYDMEFTGAYLSRVSPFDLCICTDSGLEAAYRLGVRVDMIVGDHDSVDMSLYEKYMKKEIPGSENCEIFEFPSEKDENDLEIAVKKACDAGRYIEILGATGGRTDQFLANINILKIALDRNTDAVITDRYSRLRLVKHLFTCSKDDQFGKYISFLPYTDVCTGVTLKGFKYPLENTDMYKEGSLGVSNEITDEICEMTFKNGIMTVIESADRRTGQ